MLCKYTYYVLSARQNKHGPRYSRDFISKALRQQHASASDADAKVEGIGFSCLFNGMFMGSKGIGIGFEWDFHGICMGFNVF